MLRFLTKVDRILAGLADRGPAILMPCLAALALIVFLPGFFSVPPIDRDEALFAQSSKQMAESGDLIDIRQGEGTRYNKPIGIYWLQATSATVFGADNAREIWVYRVPSLISAVAAVLLTYLIALSLTGDRRVAFVAGAVFACTLVIGAEAKIAKTDATLLATILAAQLVLARLYSREDGDISLGEALFFWIALGASMLIKGPIGLMVVGTTMAVISAIRRDIGWMRPLRFRVGFPVFLLVVLPWYAAITLVAGQAFWETSLGQDMLGKVAEGQESHGAPPGSYLAAVWLTFWPAAILLPLGLAYGWTQRARPAVQFCLAWILPTWIIFEVVATKLLHYTMPTYPALAILVAMAWMARPEGARPGLAYQAFLVLILTLGLVLAGLAMAASIYGGGGVTLVWLAGLAITAWATWTVWLAIRADLRFATLAGIAALAIGFGLSFFSHLARLDYLWPSIPLAEIQNAADMCQAPERLVVGYTEPSFAFLSEEWHSRASAESAATRAADADCALIFVDDREKPVLDAALAERGLSPELLAQVAGFDLGRGRDVVVTAYALR